MIFNKRLVLVITLSILVAISPVSAVTYTTQTPVLDSNHVMATSTLSTYYLYQPMNPANSPTGTAVGNSGLFNAPSDQVLTIDLTNPYVIQRIYYEGHHDSGAGTNNDANNFTMYGTNERADFLNTTYGTDLFNWTQIPTSQPYFDEHVPLDVADPKYITLTNSVAYRYYSFRITTNWGGSFIGFRRLQLQTADSPPVASFTKNQTECINPCAVQFTDTSTNAPTAWAYNSTNVVGNNTATTFAIIQNPDVIFNSGNHTISLKASNAFGSNISTQNAWVNVTSGVFRADFIANITSGYVNDWIQFTDLTTDSPTTWNWTFGDTGTSTTQNPLHQYVTAGSFDVSLNATNTSYYDLVTKTNYITIATLPSPSSLSISANKTYSTDTSFPVQFTTSAINPRFLYRNLSFGDGVWYNTSVAMNNVTSHVYTTLGTFTVELYETNAAGTASVSNIDFITLSNPTLVMYPHTLSVSRGVTNLMTLRVSNLTRVDGGATNITFNQTAVTIDSITANATSSQNFTITSSINNSDGTASIGISCINISSLASDVDIVDIVWRANTTRSNSTAPISFNTTAFTSFVKSNSSYNAFRYPNITYLVPSTILLTDDTWTKTITWKNAYTQGVISGVQLRLDWVGFISGSATTTTGMYTLSSKYGTTSITASADGYYNSTNAILFNNSEPVTILMSPLTGPPAQTTWYTPKQIGVTAVYRNPSGIRIPYTTMKLTAISSTIPSTASTTTEESLQIFYGINPVAANLMLNNTLIMEATTGGDGSATITVLSSIGYKVEVTDPKTGMVWESTIYPSDPLGMYTVWVGTTQFASQENTTLNYLNTTQLYITQPDPGNVTFNLVFKDYSGLTTDLIFEIISAGNLTRVYGVSLGNPGTGVVLANHTLPNVRGDTYYYGYNATRSV